MRLFALVPLLLLAACGEPPPPPALTAAEAAERDSVLALLRAANTATIDTAYARLAPPYEVTTRTAQLNADGDTVATHAHTFHVTPRTTELRHADSSGTFAYGGFEGFADRRRAVPAFAVSPAPLILSEPAYLDPRGREVFAFALAGDTTLGDAPVRVLTVTARPDEGADQTLRMARLYLDADGSLVGVRVRRRQQSALFGETSRLALFLRPSAAGWLPDRLSVDTEIQAPLTAPRHFVLDERYTTPE